MKDKRAMITLAAVAAPALVLAAVVLAAAAAWQPHRGTGTPAVPIEETLRETEAISESRQEVNPVLVIETQGQERETGE